MPAYSTTNSSARQLLKIVHSIGIQLKMIYTFGQKYNPHPISWVPLSVHSPFVTKCQYSPAWDHQPLPCPPPHCELPIPPAGKKSVDGTTENARKEVSVLLPTCAGTMAALGNTLLRVPQKVQLSSSELIHLYDTFSSKWS